MILPKCIICEKAVMNYYVVKGVHYHRPDPQLPFYRNVDITVCDDCVKNLRKLLGGDNILFDDSPIGGFHDD